jgi:MFS family permease
LDTNPISIATTSDTGVTEQPYRLRWLVAAVVLAANLMDLLDATIVNVAGPSVHRDLGGGASTLQWLSAGYTLAFAVLLIAGARLGDIHGRRRMFLIGSAGFTLFSVACAMAPTISVLIGLRILQGAFGALMIPQGFGLVKQVFTDDRELNKVMGLFGPATGLAMLGAPILAGALIDANLFGSGWRLVFLINAPIGVVAILLAMKSLPRGASHPDVKLDIFGVTLIATALVAIIYPLIQGRSDGWPLWSFIMLAVGVAMLFLFLRHERLRGKNALIERTLLKNRIYLSGIAVALALFGAFGGLLLCISLFGQLGEGWSPIHAGLTLTPMVVGMIIGMVISLALVRQLGPPRASPRHTSHRRRCGRHGPDSHQCSQCHELGPGPQPYLHRRRRRCQHRTAVPVHPDEREHGRGRVCLWSLRGGPTTLNRSGSRGPGHRVLFDVRPPTPNRRATGHRVGLRDSSDRCASPRFPPADARSRRIGSRDGPRYVIETIKVLRHRYFVTSTPVGYSERATGIEPAFSAWEAGRTINEVYRELLVGGNNSRKIEPAYLDRACCGHTGALCSFTIRRNCAC